MHPRGARTMHAAVILAWMSQVKAKCRQNLIDTSSVHRHTYSIIHIKHQFRISSFSGFVPRHINRHTDGQDRKHMLLSNFAGVQSQNNDTIII